MWELDSLTSVGMKKKQIAAVLVTWASLAVAGINNCPNTTASSSVSNGFAASIQTLPGSGATTANSLNTASLAGATGCTAVDLTFSNFAVTGSGGTDGALTANGTYVAETPAGVTANPGANPDVLTFASVRGTATVGTDGDNNDGNNNFQSNLITNVASDDVAYTVSAAPGSKIYAIVLTVTDPVVQNILLNTATGTFQIDVCVGGTATGIHTTSCPSGTLVQSPVFNLATAASQTFALSFSTPVTYADVTTAIALNGFVTNVAGFDAFSEQFDEAPEASTFFLLGGGLAGMAALYAFRRYGYARFAVALLRGSLYPRQQVPARADNVSRK